MPSPFDDQLTLKALKMAVIVRHLTLAQCCPYKPHLLLPNQMSSPTTSVVAPAALKMLKSKSFDGNKSKFTESFQYGEMFNIQ